MDGDAMLHRAALNAHTAAAPPDAKRPLTRELPPPPQFPGDALGPLRKAAEGLHERVRAPFAMCAQSVLAAATLAVQAHRDVDLPGVGPRPLTAIFASVAESGERKTGCDRVALRAVYAFEETLRQGHEALSARYAADLAAWKAVREAATKKNKGDRAALTSALMAVGAEPKPPPHPMILISDVTPDAVVNHLATGRPWGGLFTDEGGMLIGGHAMRDESRMQTGALLNKLWDGDPYRKVRVGTGTMFLKGRRLTAHVMMQGAVASRFYGDETLGGIGTLARVLTVAPETTAGTRTFRVAPSSADAALSDYDAQLTELLTRTPATKVDDPCVLDPPALTLDHDAKLLWIKFHDHAERNLRPGGRLAPIRAFGSKLVEHAGRLAAVMAVYADPMTRVLAADHMAAGIDLAEHYAAELLRLGEAAAVAPELRRAAMLLAWWTERPDPRCHLSAIYQFGPYGFRDAETARAAVAILEEHGHVTRLGPRTVLDGKPRKDAWELVP